MAGLGEWQGIDSYAARFDPLPFLAWVVPCLLLAVTFPMFLAAVHATTPPSRQIWSLTSLVFGAMYGAVLVTNYWLLASVVRSALVAGETEGLQWLVIGSPHTITGALEGVGYAFMGISALFVGFAFSGGRVASWTRWMFVANGVGGLAGFVVFGLSEILPAPFVIIGWAGLAVWNLTFPVATVLAALAQRPRTRSIGAAGGERAEPSRAALAGSTPRIADLG